MTMRIIPFLFLLSVFLIPGCTGKQDSSVPVVEILPTNTSVRTSTPTKLSTPGIATTISPTETSIIEASQTPTPLVETITLASPFENELAEARFLSYGFLDRWQFFISVLSPQPVLGQYKMLVGPKFKQKEYKCEVFQKYPNRLVCYGDLARIDDWVDFQIIPIGSDAPVFESRVSVPIPFNIY